MAIKTQKEHDGMWTIFNTENGKTASIIKINEYSLISTKTKYRIDVNGKTVNSMIENFQTAKSIARKTVK